MRSVLLTFAHPFFQNNITILHDHNAVKVLAFLCYCCKVLVGCLCHLGRCFGAWERLCEGIDVDELYSALLDDLEHFLALEQVGNALTVNSNVLISYVHNSLHLRVVICRMVYEDISLAFLKFVQHLDEACDLLLSCGSWAVISSVREVVLLECLSAVN